MLKSTLTDLFQCNVGTRQGCVSSPIIFSLFINDLVKYLKHKFWFWCIKNNDVDKIYALMFADDVSGIADTVLN